MGLDMYFSKIDKNGNKTEIKYFRKHSDLNGFLQEIWLEEHPNNYPDDFNCCSMEINEDINNSIYKFTINKNKKNYSGFFWGCSDENQWKETLKLTKKIKTLLKEGYQVVYTPWW